MCCYLSEGIVWNTFNIIEMVLDDICACSNIGSDIYFLLSKIDNMAPTSWSVYVSPPCVFHRLVSSR